MRKVNRTQLDKLLQDVEKYSSGELASGHHTLLHNKQTTTLQLVWATHEGQKKIILKITPNDLDTDAYPTYQSKMDCDNAHNFGVSYMWTASATACQEKINYAKVFPREYLERRDGPPTAALQGLPPLPHGYDVKKAQGIWRGSGDLLLLLEQGVFLVGTPVGWITVKNHLAETEAHKTKDPWQVLRVLGVQIPRLKKNRVWNEELTAQLIIIALNQ